MLAMIVTFAVLGLIILGYCNKKDKKDINDAKPKNYGTTFKFDVVGVKYHDIDKVDDESDFLFPELRYEPENEYDKNAIAVYVADYRIGYIKREETQKVRDILDSYDEVSLYADVINTDPYEVELKITARMIDHEES